MYIYYNTTLEKKEKTLHPCHLEYFQVQLDAIIKERKNTELLIRVTVETDFITPFSLTNLLLQNSG